MDKKERQQQLLNMINTEGSVRVEEAARVMSVSDMTVRRDLGEMAREGLVIRTHGGAVGIGDPALRERSHNEKKSLREEEKKRIAVYAAAMIEDGETVFLGPGTTLEKLAYELVSKKIRVVTNSLPVFEILNQSSSVDLILTGGEYRNITGAFVGFTALRSVVNMRFSKAFVSANGIAERGVFTYSETEGEIARAALGCSQRKILLADHSKYGMHDFCEFARIDDFDDLVTDGSEEEFLAVLRTLTDVHLC